MTAALLVSVMMTTVIPAPLTHTRTGKGPALVLVHGLGGDRHVWDEVAKKVAETHTVIALDLPGHGEAVVQKPVDFDHYARQIAARSRGECGAGGRRRALARRPRSPRMCRSSIREAAARAGDRRYRGIGPTWTGEGNRRRCSAGLAADREGTLRGWFGAICQAVDQVERILGRLTQARRTTRSLGCMRRHDGHATGGRRRPARLR